MELFLIRHAQSENNARAQSQRVDDPALTRLGHQQARRLAERAAGLGVTRVFTSPFLRAMETAEHVRKVTGIVPEIRVPLHEIGGCIAGTSARNFVGRPGMTRQQIAGRFPDYQIAPEIDGDGWWAGKPIENATESVRRAERLFHDTRREFGESDERIAYVMHGDFLLLLLGCFHPTALNVAWNASLSHVAIGGTSAALKTYACVRHLPNYLVTW